MQSTLINTEPSQSRRIPAQTLNPMILPAALFFTLALLLAASAVVIHLEVADLNAYAGENSLIEYLQETYLFLAGSLFAAVAFRRPSQRGFAVLASAFFYILMIRELDAVFDQISHGFWKYPAWLLATSAIIFAVRHKAVTLKPLIDYAQHRSFGLMLAGMATLLVFARLFGMGELWQALMQDAYMRPVKNLAEEGVELLAYSLIAFAAAWYCLPALMNKSR
ncbi:hypothetical protein VV869_00055 [Photobacterium sp. MCCC 1A19761]|uniref:hypothetical protein n=1 Tax=Photobacterium sp. MCCC 1A19761 TaxID=3115000 RepID=UPI00307EB38D